MAAISWEESGGLRKCPKNDIFCTPSLSSAHEHHVLQEMGHAGNILRVAETTWNIVIKSNNSFVQKNVHLLKKTIFVKKSTISIKKILSIFFKLTIFLKNET